MDAGDLKTIPLRIKIRTPLEQEPKVRPCPLMDATPPDPAPRESEADGDGGGRQTRPLRLFQRLQHK